MDLYTAPPSDYQLLDSGLERKLESICGIYFDRPTPLAIWPKRFTKIWSEANSSCIRKSDGGGFWRHRKDLPEPLLFNYNELQFILRFTSFGHCGIFFEQIAIWQKLENLIENHPKKKDLKLLNLFGYTGAASLVMAQKGAEVFHIDSAAKILEWGKENEILNQDKLTGSIHWKAEDVLNYLRFCQKKKIKFDGILMDPPTWGTGSKKTEKWVFEKNIVELFSLCADVLEEQSFLLCTTHTPGVQKEALATMVKTSNYQFQVQAGDLGVRHASDGRILPAGVYALGCTWI